MRNDGIGVYVVNNPRVRRRAATFVVRLWTEEVRGQIGRWRGQIEHIQSGETANFRDLEQMLVLIRGYRDGQKERRSESDKAAGGSRPEGGG